MYDIFINPLTNREVMQKFAKINGTNCPPIEMLKFDKHVNIIGRKAARQVNVRYRFEGVFDLYNTFIMSDIIYCSLAWYFCGKACTKKLRLYQKVHYESYFFMGHYYFLFIYKLNLLCCA